MNDKDLTEVSVSFKVDTCPLLSSELSINMCVHMPVFALHNVCSGVMAQCIVLIYSLDRMEG